MLRNVTLLLSSLAALPLAAQVGPQHSQAIINDPRSHGRIGDNLLSLNEAIQLQNRTLDVFRLSPAEQFQVNGFGDVAFAVIDSNLVTTITLERDLDVILDSPHGFQIRSADTNTLATIDCKSFKGIVSESGFSGLKSVRVLNGIVGLTLVHATSVYGTLIEGCVFEGQQTYGMLVQMPLDAGSTRILVERCRFFNQPQGMRIEDTAKDRTGNVLLVDLQVASDQTGIEVLLGEGGAMTYEFERCVVQVPGVGVEFRRIGANPTRALDLQTRHLNVTGGTVGLAVAGHPSALTTMLLRMLDLSASQTSLRLGPLGSAITGKLQDSRLSGTVEIASRGNAMQIDLANVRARPGTWTLGSQGAGLRISETILDNVNLSTQGTAGLQIDGSRFVAGSLTGLAAAPISVLGSHLGGVTLGPNSSASGSLPAAQLGSIEVTPLAPKIGATLNLISDLPAGLTGFWVMGEQLYYPLELPTFRIYFELSRAVNIPTGVRGQQTIPLAIPNVVELIGLDMVAQMAIVPDPGMQAPPLAFPPGRRFIVQ